MSVGRDPAHVTTSASSNERGRGDRWWVPIAVLAATLPTLVAFTIVLPPDAVAAIPALVVALVGVVLALLSPVFVYLDRAYLVAAGEWTPSAWYYLMAALPVAPFVAAAYLYRRHQRVGVPANPFESSD